MDNRYVLKDFYDHYNSNDVKIEIPKTVVYIGEAVFKNKQKIKKATLHENVKKMGTSVFEGCNTLRKVKFLGESQLVVIPEKAFKDCEALEEFIIPGEVGVIKRYAFSGCTNIKQIVIPKSVIAIEAGAFDKWNKDQTIEIHRDFKFGLVCKARIINHNQEHSEMKEDLIYETDDGRYMYAVKTKCGHVGRHRYMEIEFPIIAETKKEAAKIARGLPRVKHDHKFAILSVEQIDRIRYDELKENNSLDLYLKIKSKYQQKAIEDEINKRAKYEENYIRN